MPFLDHSRELCSFSVISQQMLLGTQTPELFELLTNQISCQCAAVQAAFLTFILLYICRQAILERATWTWTLDRCRL
jgi:hypothetical protein